MGKVIHGHSPAAGFTPEYRAYVAMKNRCLNTNQHRFKDYGERGITICDRWLLGADGETGFQCFLSDMSKKPTSLHSLDRIENDDGYRPGNCRWATPEEQARNTRASRMVNVFGEPVSMAEAVEKMGAVSYATARMRVHRGWSPYDAVLTPKGKSAGSANYPVLI